jgi:hypothetical protein
LIVVDDFYDDLDAVRRTALAAEYEKPGQTNYPGRNSLRAFMTPEAQSKLMSLAGGAGRYDHLPSSSSGSFRSTLAHEAPTAFDVHCDRAALSGLVFLNAPEECGGRIGTSFWRHRRTGLVGLPADSSAEERHRISEEVIKPDSMDRDKWELRLQVPMVPNRMIMFPGRLFHSPHDRFGTTLENGRLIQVFFLHRTGVL